MARILVVHSSFDGQTRLIAERIAELLRERGHETTVRDANKPIEPAQVIRNDAVIVGGAVRYGKYSRGLKHFVDACRAQLETRPNAFFTVCMSARDPAKAEVADGYARKFLAGAGWKPGSVAKFAGALRYSRYNPFIRFMMRLISVMAGGDTDTSRDYEYTEWTEVAAFARAFAATVESPAAMAA